VIVTSEAFPGPVGQQRHLVAVALAATWTGMRPAVAIQAMDEAILIDLGVVTTALEAKDLFFFINFIFLILDFIHYLHFLHQGNDAVIIEVGAAIQARVSAISQQHGGPAAAAGAPGMNGDIIRTGIARALSVDIVDAIVLIKILWQLARILVIIIVLPHFFIVRHTTLYT
jgi:hypothetical protein